MTPACLLHALVVAALAGAPPEPATADRWVAQLGSPRWEEREAASEQLLLLDKAAIPALERALESRDPEVRHRALALLDRLRWKVPATLAGPLREAMEHYASLPERQRLALLTQVANELREETGPLLRQAVRTDPSPLVRRAALERLARIDEMAAEVELRALLADGVHAAWAGTELGELLARRGQIDEAITAYEGARRAGAKEPRVAEALASLHERQGKWAKARDVYRELVAADPDNVSYRLRLGVCHTMLGEADKAEATWREIVEAKGADPQAYMLLVNAYLGIGARDKAVATLREGCKKYPADFELLHRLGAMLLDSGQVEEAIEVYEQARAAAPADYQRRLISAELVQALSRTNRLPAYLERREKDLAALDQEISGLLRKLAEESLAKGNRAAARRALERLVGLYPTTDHGRWAAETLRKLGK